MHLGQTASFLAKVLNRPEPTVRMVSRLLREGGWTEKGPRGRNAPHVSSTELANFLIALMCSPDSPAAAIERLPHFSSLPLDDERASSVTFGRAVGLLLDRLASGDWGSANEKDWVVSLSLEISSAAIYAQDEEHGFSALKGVDESAPIIDHLPFFGGLEVSVTVRGFTLYRIAKAVLCDAVDPMPEIRKSLEAES